MGEEDCDPRDILRQLKSKEVLPIVSSSKPACLLGGAATSLLADVSR